MLCDVQMDVRRKGSEGPRWSSLQAEHRGALVPVPGRSHTAQSNGARGCIPALGRGSWRGFCSSWR